MSYFDRAGFLQDASRAIICDGEICGLLLLRKEGENYSPVFLYSESEYEQKALVKDAIVALKSSVGESEQIICRKFSQTKVKKNLMSIR